MTPVLIRSEDIALIDALAGILGRLRGYAFGRSFAGSEDAIHREADGFVERISGHLRYVEKTLFPASPKVRSESAVIVEEFKKDHRLLSLYARTLADHLRRRDNESAYDVGRSFLAALLDHIHREMDAVY